MLFNSYIFIFLFLPLALLGWYCFNHFKLYKLAQVYLCAMSLWFYAYFHIGYLFILLGSVLCNYTISLLIQKKCEVDRQVRKGHLLQLMRVLALACNLGILFFYKYYDFFLSNINQLFHSEFTLLHLLLPLGISFFTFQQLGYVLDRCKGEVAHTGFIDYLTYVSFFPQLIAGPIVHHSELLPQFQDMRRRVFDGASFSEGCIYFIYGLSKKVLLADRIGRFAGAGFANIAALDTPAAILVIIAYCLQLYFDFSGYSDMAIGLGKMFHIELPLNFNEPFRATNLQEFWNRWHITLGRFFTKYVYIPLGGSKHGLMRTLCNIFIVFFLSGIWHGANWTFIVWGACTGVIVALCRVLRPAITKISNVSIGKHVLQIVNFIVFCLLLIFFRSDSINDAGLYFSRLFSGESYHATAYVAYQVNYSELWLVDKVFTGPLSSIQTYYREAIMIGSILIGLIFLFGPGVHRRMQKVSYKLRTAICFGFLLLWSVLSFSGVTTFLYFNF